MRAFAGSLRENEQLVRERIAQQTQARQDRQRRAGALPPERPDRDEATKMVVVDMWGRPWSPHRGMVCATPNDGSMASAGGKGRVRRPASAGARRS